MKKVAAKPGREPKQGTSNREHREELLDEALEETFPASDTPSIALPERRPTQQPATKTPNRKHKSA